jgi:hypothetical protein
LRRGLRSLDASGFQKGFSEQYLPNPLALARHCSHVLYAQSEIPLPRPPPPIAQYCLLKKDSWALLDGASAATVAITTASPIKARRMWLS